MRIKREVQLYHGGGEKPVLAPWVYALHDVVKDREQTRKLTPRFIPSKKKIPDHILDDWMRECEQGTEPVNPRLRQWVKDTLEADEQQSLRDAAIECATTLRHYAKAMREGKELPPGGVVGLKYLADGAGFLAGKRNETGGKTAQESLSLGGLTINVGQRPTPKKLRPREPVQAIEAEFTEIPEKVTLGSSA